MQAEVERHPDKIADFTARTVRLLLDDALRARLAAGAAESAEKYDINRTAAQLLQHYLRLGNDKARAPGSGQDRHRLRNIFR